MSPARFGAGFRDRHFEELIALTGASRLDWLEVFTDNVLGVGGRKHARLERLRADYPIVLHGVGLSVAGSDPLDEGYLMRLRALADRSEPLWVGDHLCWTTCGGRQSHDLLPPAYTEEVLDHVAGRVARAQDLLGRPLVLENASAYVVFRADRMSAGEFFAELCRRTGCAVLLDVNNLFVNECNLGSRPADFLRALPPGSVAYMHLAGHAEVDGVRIDTHDAEVTAPVWALFEEAARRFPEAGVIVERDENIPPLADLLAEVERARDHHRRARERAPQAGAAAMHDGTRSVAGAAGAGAENAAVAGEHVSAARASAAAAMPAQWPSLQREFWNRLVDKERGFDHAGDEGLGLLLRADLPVCAARGMRVYSDAYAHNLRRALAFHFPALEAVLETDDFDRMAAAYLHRHPPVGQGFTGIGRHLSEFLRRHRFDTDYGVAADVFADLAALEQARLEVAEEVDQTAAVTADDLAALCAEDWERARFLFARALRVVRVAHEVAAVVEAVERGESPPRPARSALAYLVRRTDGVVSCEALRCEEAGVLETLVGGAPFGAACAPAGEMSETDGRRLVEDAARLLTRAASWGLILSMAAAPSAQGSRTARTR